ncbi:hypothetical protein [Budvicia diplopodorum]|uniref:hypothetical protein n=1 Tax=Budvicia diplopodorum TaxID=1119056 RepID=UPI0013590244|nr:hypothetical protein [Budvicia diplopodorum]
MGEVLLGYDVALMAQSGSKDELLKLDKDKLTDALITQSSIEQIAEIEQMMGCFWEGILLD